MALQFLENLDIEPHWISCAKEQTCAGPRPPVAGDLQTLWTGVWVAFRRGWSTAWRWLDQARICSRWRSPPPCIHFAPFKGVKNIWNRNRISSILSALLNLLVKRRVTKLSKKFRHQDIVSWPCIRVPISLMDIFVACWQMIGKWSTNNAVIFWVFC